MEFRLQEGKKPNHMIEKDEHDKRIFVESLDDRVHSNEATR